MIKVIIFSDIKIYCEGLSRILSSVDPIQVVATENRFEDAIDRVAGTSPDVVLLDMTMAHSSRLARRLVQLFPATHIVALAVPEDEQDVFECAQAGIAGYVARESSLEELIDTVLCAARGEFRCSAKIAACIFHRVQSARQPAEVADPVGAEADYPLNAQDKDGPISTLTRREQQITILMAEGLSNKQISSSLFIEVSTVKNHVHNILVKLNVSSRAQVANLLQGRSIGAGSRSMDPGSGAGIHF